MQRAALRSSVGVAPAPTSAPDPLLFACTLALLAVVLIQCITPLTPLVAWDADPRSPVGSAPRTDLSPTAFAWINTATVALAAAALFAHARKGGRIDRLAVALASIGAAVCLYHFPADARNLARGGWVAAVAAGVAFLHLGRHEPLRRWAVAALAAIAIPMALRAAWYVWVEHAQTVREFLRTQDEFLRARGWEPGSAMAELYLRRVREAAALGAFGLSNVLGSIAAALAVLAAALAAGLFRAGRRAAAWVPAGLAAASVLAVVLSRSRGAAGAMLLGALLLAAAWLASGRPRARRLLAPLGLALVALAIGAVLARGLAGPPPRDSRPGFTRTLYFRYQYWAGAARALAHSGPSELALGAGPARFQDAYLLHKDPLSPEEVSSTHNVFFDWLAMLGVGGLAWSALLVRCLWRGGAAAAADLSTSPARSPTPLPRVARSAEPSNLATGLPPRVVPAMLLGAAVFGIQYVVQYDLMTRETALLWLVGLVGFVAAVVVLTGDQIAGSAWTRVGFFAAAAVLLFHNQIEMTFFHDGSSTVAWALLGLAGAGTESSDSSTTTRWAGPVSAALFGAIAAALALMYAVPVTRHTTALDAAATAMRRTGPSPAAERALDAALAVVPGDRSARRWAVTIQVLRADECARRGDTDAATAAFDRARRYIADSAAQGRREAGLSRLRAQVEERAAESLRQPDLRRAALEAWRDTVAQTPYSLEDRLSLADTLWALGQADEARSVYRKCLELSEQAYLDPAKQLSRADRERVVTKLDGSASAR